MTTHQDPDDESTWRLSEEDLVAAEAVPDYVRGFISVILRESMRLSNNAAATLAEAEFAQEIGEQALKFLKTYEVKAVLEHPGTWQEGFDAPKTSSSKLAALEAFDAGYLNIGEIGDELT